MVDNCVYMHERGTSRCLRHAARVASPPLQPLNARGWVQVAGEGAADDRHIESCGGCLSHVYIYIYRERDRHMERGRCRGPCAYNTHNHTDENRMRLAVADGDVMQRATHKHALVLRSNRSSSSRDPICRTGQSGCTSRHSDSDPRFWHSAAPSGHSGSKAPVVGRYRHVHTN